MKLRTNNIARSLWNWHDLDDKQKSELDWRDTDELQESFLGFIYKGQIYDLSDFVKLDDDNYPINGWHGAFAQSAFHAIVIKMTDDNFVIVGQVFS